MEVDVDEEKDLLMKLLAMKGKPGAKASVLTVQKTLEPNVFQTEGVILTVDGARYILPMDLLQEMNKYELPNKRVVYSPFPMVEVAAKIWDKRSDEDCDIMDRHLIDKHFEFAEGAQHLCPDEKALHFASIE